MDRLSRQLQRDQRRFRILEAYAVGRPPLAWGSVDEQKNFYRFQKVSKTNFASTIVEAPCMRIAMRSITTAANSDATGDPEAWALLKANAINSRFADLARLSKTFGRAYLATSEAILDGGRPVITIEDPRQMITEAHPLMPHVPRAAFKLFHDAAAQMDVAVLWLPGQRWIATHPRIVNMIPRSNSILGRPEPVRVKFAPSSFVMAPQREGRDDPDTFYSDTYNDQEIPVDMIPNQGEVGEFELHTDLLDRINHMVLQRVVTATLQAFRQRAIKQSTDPGVPALPEFDEAGKRIDYSNILEAGPDAVWLLPPGAELWESGQVDLNGILASTKQDTLHLSAVTFTPMAMFTPDAATQTAEGAQLGREGVVFKVEDFEARAEIGIARAVARCFRYTDDAVRGDASKIAVQWAPADRPSLSEMGAAASQVQGTLTWEQTQQIVWQQTPAQIAVAKAQRAQDLVLAQQQARLAQPPQQQQPQRPQNDAQQPADNTKPVAGQNRPTAGFQPGRTAHGNADAATK